MFINDLFNKKTIAEESPTLSRPQGVPTKQTPPPLNVPQGWEAKTQADGSTRISKIGSMSSADYKQNMANYKAQNWTPEKMADYGQRMASGQGYSDAERTANYQQQQKFFGQYADQPLKDVDEARDGDTNFGSTVAHGSWVVYDGVKVKRFKTREGAKAYAEKTGGKVASSEFYADNIQGKQGVTEGLGKSIKRAAQGWGGSQDKPADIVKRNKAHDTDTAKRLRAGMDDADEHTPQGLQKRVLDRKLKGVTEGEVLQFPKSPQDKNVRANLEQRLLAAFNQIVDYADDNGIDILEKNAQLYSKLFDKYDTEDATLDPEQAMARNEPIEVVAQVVKEVEHIAKHIDEYIENMWGDTFGESSMTEQDIAEENPYMDNRPSSVTAKQADELGAAAKRAFKPEYYEPDTEPAPKRRDWDYSDPDIQPIVKDYLNKNVMDKKPMTYKQDVPEGSVQDKLHHRHQELRKKRGAPDPDYYKELRATYDLPDQERYAKAAELKKKYKVTNEDRERYLEEMRRAGYEIVTERATLCPECGGPAFENRVLAEKQDACYHKVKSRYKVWPSAYASGALVRCRKKGAANWGNKSKK